jgi:septum site-determining protein MinD
MLSHEDVVDVLSIDLVGLVEADDLVVIATNSGTPLVMQSNSKAGQAFKRIAMRLNGLPDLPIEVSGVSKSLWEKIRSKTGFGKKG